MISPISFRPGPVTFWTTVVYLALLIPIVIINEEPPPAPSESPYLGLNLTEAWFDLTAITKAYHPYNSHFNDEVRTFLLKRIEQILEENKVGFDTYGSGSSKAQAAVTVFNDMTSNVTAAMSTGIGGTNAGHQSSAATAAYFEGTNIIVYIRGKADPEGAFWESRRETKGLVLINAHYDSVATGFGATDDGMGVVTVLQAIKYFTHPEHQPERGIVAMLNNGEEDWLYGARAFGRSPLLPYVHTFLNVEGAGAGGRALLFRTSDREVTQAYRGTSDPFGTVIGSDAFSLGFIRSGTDYSVLHDVYGQRGLDLAFFKPRSSYHTNRDDAMHTSRASLWHMLSASIHTTERLSSDTGDTFTGPRSDGARGKVANGSPSDGVWFDLFGKGFVLFGLRTMFAWSLAVLIATPLILILITYILHKLDKYYFFATRAKGHEDDDNSAVSFGAFKGLFRFPFALTVAGGLTLGVALLMRKENPFIIYSSQYSVWAMSISIFYFSFWCIMRGANFARPSALSRGYVNMWLFIIGWAILVAVAVTEDRGKLGAGYIFVFLQTALFLTLLISLCEFFALPKKSTWAAQAREDHEAREQGSDDHAAHQLPPVAHHESISVPPTRSSTASGLGARSTAGEGQDDDEEPPTERTPLVGGHPNGEFRTTFATTYRRSITALVDGARKMDDGNGEPYEFEQAWSGRLPSWLWFVQFLVLGPFIIILAGQTGLMLTDAVHQTGSDGSSLLLPYLLVVLLTVLLLLPLSPFIHRVTHHIPVFLLAVFVGTLIYNLVAFPFSESNRYKAFFIQTIDLDSGENKVCYGGIEEYLRKIVAEMPSASGRELHCGPARRPELTSCCYDGSAVPPRLDGDLSSGLPPEKGYAALVTLNATRGSGNTASIKIDANNTKACFLSFKKPVSRFSVKGGSGWDDRFGQYPDAGVGLIKLWRRDWSTPWTVDFEWKDEKAAVDDEGSPSGSPVENGELKTRESGMDGTVTCMWSDANIAGTILALDEGLKYAPPWAAITKTSEGLVEGRKSFLV
ncbi:hypothetical protein QBC37DRAFT_398201 [Rhypophila decipiens]|uniref:Peptide hydrolase n=1 Tax=Rhypophila decipiens TaxID=261697 RepID=A0AAN6YBG4_9PEZI|nr:hypothetical protein QBC37DRAFT_398201 [Rhypophila decipiens]